MTVGAGLCACPGRVAAAPPPLMPRTGKGYDDGSVGAQGFARLQDAPQCGREAGAKRSDGR